MDLSPGRGWTHHLVADIPVEEVGRDRIVAIWGRRRESLLRLLQSHHEQVGSILRQPLHAFAPTPRSIRADRAERGEDLVARVSRVEGQWHLRGHLSTDGEVSRPGTDNPGSASSHGTRESERWSAPRRRPQPGERWTLGLRESSDTRPRIRALPDSHHVRSARPRPRLVRLGRRDRQSTPILGAQKSPASLVHRPVMPVTQQHHVLEGGGSAMGPVHDVVPVNPQM